MMVYLRYAAGMDGGGYIFNAKRSWTHGWIKQPKLEHEKDMEKKMESDADGKLLKMGKKEDAFSFSSWTMGGLLFVGAPPWSRSTIRSFSTNLLSSCPSRPSPSRRLFDLAFASSIDRFPLLRPASPVSGGVGNPIYG
jgi:hypothetical protein